MQVQDLHFYHSVINMVLKLIRPGAHPGFQIVGFWSSHLQSRENILK